MIKIIKKTLVFLRIAKQSGKYADGTPCLPRQPHLPQPNVSGSASCNPNPYQLIWYKQRWSEKRIRKNNSKYWEWEIVHNGFKCP
jgi:hypothetical protein